MKRTLTALLAGIALIVGVMLITRGADATAVTQNVPLHNNTADPGDDCPDTLDGAAWHFIIAPNNGTYAFVTITLNLDGDTVVFTGSDIIPNGTQHDNVFVLVPTGYTLTDLELTGSSADITPSTPAPEGFNLSHVCEGPVPPITEPTTIPTTTTTKPPATTTTLIPAAAAVSVSPPFTG